MNNRNVHIRGVGIIGGAVALYLASEQKCLGLDRITVSKRTADRQTADDLEDLLDRGIQVAAPGPETMRAFEECGVGVAMMEEDAIAEAAVVLDCAPGAEGRLGEYTALSGPRGFIAQGSEQAFGKPYALGINDDSINWEEDSRLTVLSCNTHAIARLLQAVAYGPHAPVDRLIDASVSLDRRDGDLGQKDGFIPAPLIGVDADEVYGSHHARDVAALFSTVGVKVPITSTADKLNTQHTHKMVTTLLVSASDGLSVDDVYQALEQDEFVALTSRYRADQIAHNARAGVTGRILMQVVVPDDAISVYPISLIEGDHSTFKVVIKSFTTQDGNSILSTVTAMLRYLYPDPSEFASRFEVVERHIRAKQRI